jgi:hypothetical protein
VTSDTNLDDPHTVLWTDPPCEREAQLRQERADLVEDWAFLLCDVHLAAIVPTKS